MSTYTQPLSASFSAAYTGQVSNIRWTIYDNAGTPQIAATNTPSGNTTTESTDASGAANTGVYLTRATIDTSWLPIHVKANIVGQAGVSASTILGIPSVAPSTFLDGISIADVTSDTDGRSTFPKMLRALFNRHFNKVTSTASQMQVFSDANVATQTLAVSDDGTTATKGKSA